ncbi:MAG TPA: hypothetical protein VLI41_01515 [Phenylobacterium sp.]|uniref:hypothetical protein n=1 Tax=Phenylobacterium sp. TaxID=1871053 RepID=UPI002C0C4462|nr:hypothetical protein [Phenylobacterium sp.]HSV01857.1 hypothetical protein [Phenylobacterium sp.]
MGHEKRFGAALKKGTEQDALSGWRKLLRFRPGARKAAKNSFNRRVRHQQVEPPTSDE